VIKVFNCLVYEHDLSLVLLAAAVCIVGSFATFGLLRHFESLRSQTWRWIVLTSMASGFSIWATHFIAMLAFTPGMPVGYDVPLTITSLVLAIVLTGAGLARALVGTTIEDRVQGGAIVGLAIVTMHMTGISAFEVQGRLQWDALMLAVAMFVSPALCACALVYGLDRSIRHYRLIGVGLFTLAICAHHFVAMASMSIVPDPTIVVSSATVPPGAIAVVTAIGGFAILLFALTTIELDRRDQKRSEAEANHMRDLAEAAVEGLMITDGETVLAANSSMRNMLAWGDMRGIHVHDIFPDGEAPDMASYIGNTAECVVVSATGEQIPVEVVARAVAFEGRSGFALSFRDLRDRRRAEAEIKFLAFSDPLTGLPNRRQFSERLDQQVRSAKTSKAPFAMLALDLDRFKYVNDTLGHGVGDKLLMKVSQRLKHCLRDNDIVARLGGDEFSILISNSDLPRAASRIARRVVELLSRPFIFDGHVINIGTSVGITHYPWDAETAEDLVKNADLALYRAKNNGRGTVAFFEREMDLEMQQRRALELDLHTAVARQDFTLHYQPLQTIKDDRIVSFEALIRWRHAEKGLIGPSDFIPVAEETGLIVAIGEWVLQEACTQAVQWPAEISVAVNLSPVQFRSPRLLDAVRSALDKSGLAATRLELEITEAVLLQNSQETLATLRKLRDLGVSISMDDFGTGYSSLNYLRSFPFNKIKIDRTFISELGENVESDAIVRTIISLGQSLGITTTAEGVETAEQRLALSIQGCDQMQGFLLSRPLPHSELSGLFEVRNREAA